MLGSITPTNNSTQFTLCRVFKDFCSHWEYNPKCYENETDAKKNDYPDYRAEQDRIARCRLWRRIVYGVDDSSGAGIASRGIINAFGSVSIKNSDLNPLFDRAELED
jgi:hypothetical protein